MKKISKLLLLFAALIVCCGTLKASEGPIHSVFWFSVSIKIDSENQKLEILDSATTVNSGWLKDFQKAVKKGIAQHQVTIGPFHTEKEANNARIYYKKSKDEINELPQPDAPSEMYWFAFGLTEKRIGSYKFKYCPFAVHAGSANEFTKDLFENLLYQFIVIGPFWDNIQAEEAKYIYRIVSKQ